MPVIYLDILIVLNWLSDYLLLLSVACLCRRPIKTARAAAASFVGGCSALLILLPPLSPVLCAAADAAVAAVMVCIGFGCKDGKRFAQSVFLLFLCGTLFSGVCTLLYSLLPGDGWVVHNGKLYADISPLMLVGFTLISYAAIRLYEKLTRKHAAAEREFRLTIDDGNGQYRTKALYDTGLHLREPFSGSPVIVVEQNKLTPFLSAKHRTADGSDIPNGCRMIPYNTVKGKGLLPAFRPKAVKLYALDGTAKDVSGVYVALSDPLGRGEYEALIGSDVVE